MSKKLMLGIIMFWIIQVVLLYILSIDFCPLGFTGFLCATLFTLILPLIIVLILFGWFGR